MIERLTTRIARTDDERVAVQSSAQDPVISSAAKRNLSIALFRRGWE